jgi:hypothetical protein
MKKVTLEMTEKQYACYQKASEELMQIGIPVSEKNIMQVMISNRDESQIAEDFLRMMKSLIANGKKKLPTSSKPRKTANDIN